MSLIIRTRRVGYRGIKSEAHGFLKLGSRRGSWALDGRGMINNYDGRESSVKSGGCRKVGHVSRLTPAMANQCGVLELFRIILKGQDEARRDHPRRSGAREIFGGRRSEPPLWIRYRCRDNHRPAEFSDHGTGTLRLTMN